MGDPVVVGSNPTGGEAILDRLLYACRALKGLSRKELLRVAEECGGIEVIRKRYRPWDDGEVIIVLRLRGFESRSDSHSSERKRGYRWAASPHHSR